MKDIGMNPGFRASGHEFDEPEMECYICNRGCDDHCWHCEKPVCRSHSGLEKTTYATALYCDHCREAITKARNLATLPHIARHMIAQGYLPKPPDSRTGRIDQSITGTKCSQCRGAVVYEPWSKPGSYLAIAYCPICGYREEC